MQKTKNGLTVFRLNKEYDFEQYIHKELCKIPCLDCGSYYYRVFKRKTGPKTPQHFNCDCTYENIIIKPVGSISNKGLNAPDVYLFLHGKLPDYYITKEEAINIYGWNSRRNTIAGKAPGKMIGGIPYNNDEDILPIKEGRLWYECDVDYEKGGWSSKRLFYSNDGLMFFSPDHGETKFYLIKEMDYANNIQQK